MATEKSVSITGKIQITDKIYFEYYQLYKPDKRELKYYHNSVRINNQLQIEYLKDKKEYEASKQLIEVKNVAKSKYSKYWFFNVIRDKFGKIEGKAVKNNQPCTAEIKGESAIIIELTKE